MLVGYYNGAVISVHDIRTPRYVYVARKYSYSLQGSLIPLHADHLLNHISYIEGAYLFLEFVGLDLPEVKHVLDCIYHDVALAVLYLYSFAYLLNNSS